MAFMPGGSGGNAAGGNGTPGSENNPSPFGNFNLQQIQEAIAQQQAQQQRDNLFHQLLLLSQLQQPQQQSTGNMHSNAAAAAAAALLQQSQQQQQQQQNAGGNQMALLQTLQQQLLLQQLMQSSQQQAASAGNSFAMLPANPTLLLFQLQQQQQQQQLAAAAASAAATASANPLLAHLANAMQQQQQASAGSSSNFSSSAPDNHLQQQRMLMEALLTGTADAGAVNGPSHAAASLFSAFQQQQQQQPQQQLSAPQQQMAEHRMTQQSFMRGVSAAMTTGESVHTAERGESSSTNGTSFCPQRGTSRIDQTRVFQVLQAAINEPRSAGVAASRASGAVSGAGSGPARDVDLSDRIEKLISDNEVIVEPVPMLLKRRTYNHRGGAGPSNTPSVDNDSNASGSARCSPGLRSLRAQTTRSQSLFELNVKPYSTNGSSAASGSLTTGQPLVRAATELNILPLSAVNASCSQQQLKPSTSAASTAPACVFCNLQFPNDACLQAHEPRCSRRVPEEDASAAANSATLQQQQLAQQQSTSAAASSSQPQAAARLSTPTQHAAIRTPPDARHPLKRRLLAAAQQEAAVTAVPAKQFKPDRPMEDIIIVESSGRVADPLSSPSSKTKAAAAAEVERTFLQPSSVAGSSVPLPRRATIASIPLETQHQPQEQGIMNRVSHEQLQLLLQRLAASGLEKEEQLLVAAAAVSATNQQPNQSAQLRQLSVAQVLQQHLAATTAQRENAAASHQLQQQPVQPQQPLKVSARSSESSKEISQPCSSGVTANAALPAREPLTQQSTTLLPKKEDVSIPFCLPPDYELRGNNSKPYFLTYPLSDCHRRHCERQGRIQLQPIISDVSASAPYPNALTNGGRAPNYLQTTALCTPTVPMFVIQMTEKDSMYHVYKPHDSKEGESAMTMLFLSSHSARPRVGEKDYYRYTTACKEGWQQRMTHSSFWEMSVRTRRMQKALENSAMLAGSQMMTGAHQVPTAGSQLNPAENGYNKANSHNNSHVITNGKQVATTESRVVSEDVEMAVNQPELMKPKPEAETSEQCDVKIFEKRDQERKAEDDQDIIDIKNMVEEKKRAIHANTEYKVPITTVEDKKAAIAAAKALAEELEKEMAAEMKEDVPMMSKQQAKREAIIGGFSTDEVYVYVRGRGRGRYVCDRCGIRCKKPSMLNKHIRSHTDIRPFRCKTCNFSFKTKGNLTKHLHSKSHRRKSGTNGANKSAGVDESDESSDEGRLEIATEDSDNDEERNPQAAANRKHLDEFNKMGASDEEDDSENFFPEDGLEKHPYHKFGQENILFERGAHTPPSRWMLVGEERDSHWPELPKGRRRRSQAMQINSLRRCPSAPPAVLFTPPNNAKKEALDSLTRRLLASPSNSGQLSSTSKTDMTAVKQEQETIVNAALESPTVNKEVQCRATAASSSDLLTASAALSTVPLVRRKRSAGAASIIGVASHLPSDTTTASSYIMEKEELPCNQCDRVFRKPSELALHQHTHNIELRGGVGKQRQTIACPECKLPLKTRLQLGKHMEAVHAVNGQMPAGPLLQLAAAAGGTDAIGQTLGGMLEIGGIDINSSAAAHLTGIPPSSNPRSFVCRDCNIGFRKHGILAKHLRSKTHVMKLESQNMLPEDSLTLITKKDNGACLGEVDTSSCETARASILGIVDRIRAELNPASSTSRLSETTSQTANACSSNAPASTPAGISQVSSAPEVTGTESRSLFSAPMQIGATGGVLSALQRRGAAASVVQSSSDGTNADASALEIAKAFLMQRLESRRDRNDISSPGSHANATSIINQHQQRNPVSTMWIPPKAEDLLAPTPHTTTAESVSTTEALMNMMRVQQLQNLQLLQQQQQQSGSSQQLNGNHNVARSHHPSEQQSGGSARGIARTPPFGGLIAGSPLTRCAVCQAHFDTPQDYQVHVLTDHVTSRDGSQMKCPLANCDKVFPNRDCLRAHVTAHFLRSTATPDHFRNDDVESLGSSNGRGSVGVASANNGANAGSWAKSTATGAASGVPNKSPSSEESDGEGGRSSCTSTTSAGGLRICDEDEPLSGTPQSSTETMVLPCATCGVLFNNATALQTHWLTHITKRPFVCENCDAGFTTTEHLALHAAIHQQ